MFRCFIDDSGKNPSEPVFVLGAWCGTVSAMEGLSEAWDVVLKQPPRIDYYRHTEAAARVGSFKNFSVHQATSKTYDPLSGNSAESGLRRLVLNVDQFRELKLCLLD